MDSEIYINTSLGNVIVRIRKSPRASRYTLKAEAIKGFEVVVPKRTNLRSIKQFVNQCHLWIEERLPSMIKSREVLLTRCLGEHTELPVLGSLHRVVFAESSLSSVKVSTSTDNGEPLLLIRVPFEHNKDFQYANEERNIIAEKIKMWFEKEAWMHFSHLRKKVESQTGLFAKRVEISDTISRWGSCDREGHLKLNWRLMMAPAEIGEYVLIHELAHIREHGHGRQFWELVGKHCHNWKHCREWLRQYGETLTILVDPPADILNI